MIHRRSSTARARVLLGRLVADEPAGTLGDFTTTRRLVYLCALALPIGIVSTFVAWALLRLIAVFTNLFWFGRVGDAAVNPSDANVGLLMLAIPVAGGLVVGFAARFGSEKIRGHGIPEAIEAILVNGSRVEPRVAILKPLTSAIAIGSGGPFGAEGPIILTGGAFGSIASQFLHLSSIERRTLLVAGAAAGMSATFSAPLASVLLAAELLLFEWKPRSLIPVGVASGTAAVARQYILDPGPLFPVPLHSAHVSPEAYLGCLFVGLSAGVLSMLLTTAVYAAEDGFHRLPIHWMWWPALGGLAIGAGGLVFPEALGVGYSVIETLLSGDAPNRIIIGVIIVKSLIWATALGSGTSGGVLAPLLMIGCGVGALEAPFLPDEGAGFWAMISMGAVLGGTMRSPFTAIVFVLELTHDINSLLPLLLAVMVAHALTVLTLRRSILTEKLSRRGLHLGREYAPDPLENVLVHTAMRHHVQTLPDSMTLADLRAAIAAQTAPPHGLYPIVGPDGVLRGAITGRHLAALAAGDAGDAMQLQLADIQSADLVLALPDENMRAVADRMARTGRTQIPVVDSRESMHPIGMVTLREVLAARQHQLLEETVRERQLSFPRPGRRSRVPAGASARAHIRS